MKIYKKYSVCTCKPLKAINTHNNISSINCYFQQKSINFMYSKTSTIIGNTVMAEFKKVTGIGGVFFKCKEPGKVKEWYSKHLGLKTDEYGSLFEFRLADKPEEKAYLQWSPFPDNTKYFDPSTKDFMINYRVENLERLLEELKKEGVQIVGDLEVYDYGKFAHIIDIEGNKIELWEPIDNALTKTDEGNAAQ